MTLHLIILSAFISFYFLVLIIVGIKMYVDRETLFKGMEIEGIKEIIDRILIKNQYSIKVRNILEEKFANTKPCVQLREIIIQNESNQQIDNNKIEFISRVKEFNKNF